MTIPDERLKEILNEYKTTRNDINGADISEVEAYEALQELLSLREQLKDMTEYADKLVEALPGDYLPKDIENIREANMHMAQKIIDLEAQLKEDETQLRLYVDNTEILREQRDKLIEDAERLNIALHNLCSYCETHKLYDDMGLSLTITQIEEVEFVKHEDLMEELDA